MLELQRMFSALPHRGIAGSLRIDESAGVSLGSCGAREREIGNDYYPLKYSRIDALGDCAAKLKTARQHFFGYLALAENRFLNLS